MKQTYFQLSEGMWSPRDERYGYRVLDVFDTRAKGAQLARQVRRDGFKGPLILEQVTTVQVWDAEPRETAA